MKLTELTARQIRYYEEHDLIQPERTSGNQRLFSFNDVDRLLEIKNFLDKGLNIAGIKLLIQGDKYEPKEIKVKENDLSKKELRTKLREELTETGKFGKTSLIQGELSRFFTRNKK